jgi:hypothetical protein
MSTSVGNLSVELGISDDQLRAGLAQAVVQAQQAGQKMQAALNKSTAGPSQDAEAQKHRNMALLQASRGVQDFQAGGLMGVVNNVEGVSMSIARAMGKSTDVAAALAGKMTLIAVAVQVGLPLVKSLADSVSASLGLVSTNAEKAANSVKGMMGGGGHSAAMAEGRKADAEFLTTRTQSHNITSESSLNAISRFFGMAATESEAASINMKKATAATAAMSESFQMGAKAAKDMRWLQKGSTAENDKTTGRMEAEVINKKVYQAAVDKYGGGDNLRTKLETEGRKAGMTKTQSRELYGGFSEGDAAATKKVEGMLNLKDERTKAMADDYERATGSAQELLRIEKDRASSETKSMVDEYDAMVATELERQSLEKDKGKAQERLDELTAQRARTEVVGSSDVFNRNLNAGTGDDPTVKAIEKQTEEIRRMTDEIKGLG